MRPLVEVNELLVRRGGRIALDIQELDIQRGEVLALVGPNGAGKSTLLLALARLVRAEGAVLFDGRPLHEWDELEYRRRISFVFQDPLLFDLSVNENVALGLRFRAMSAEQREQRAAHWLELLDIAGLRRRRAAELSGGEAQRVSLARALVLDPDLLLLDEPFAALDPPARLRLMDDLSKLLRQDRRTAVFVTHDLGEAARLGDRIGVMMGGTLRQVGTARQIKAYPADDEVAAFLATL